MKKSRVSKTAQVNLMMLADLGIEEAVHFRNIMGFTDNPLDIFAHIPMASRLPLCISMVSEILYQRTNQLIFEKDSPIILDLACGYSPRVLKVCDRQHTYIGVDLSDVVGKLKAHRKELIHETNDYYSIDLTKREEMEALAVNLKAPVTVITQGLLTYLTVDQKSVLMENIRSLLEKAGGCWIIPDAAPDRMLPEIFSSVLGSGAVHIFSQVMKIVDAAVKRDKDKIGWKSTEEICSALKQSGFRVERVPLYTDSLEMRSLEKVNPDQAEKLKENWRKTDALIVTLP